jgi:hypothetical protein
LFISPDSLTACELHYHLNVGQPRVSSAYRAIVLSIGFALVFAGQGTTFPCRHSCFAATEDGDFTAAFLDARCGHF